MPLSSAINRLHYLALCVLVERGLRESEGALQRGCSSDQGEEYPVRNSWFEPLLAEKPVGNDGQAHDCLPHGRTSHSEDELLAGSRSLTCERIGNHEDKS